MSGVPSALVARNASWVRQQAQSFARHLPANVEKADLIQAGLIAVAQAALHFDWPDDPETDQAREAFVRYARQRVKGAMLDELRQMDTLTRAQRRKVRVVQIARERWQASNGAAPTLAQLAEICGFDIDEIATLDRMAAASQAQSLDSGDSDGDGEHGPWIERMMPATERSEVEARVDTAIVMRRLEAFFAKLPERERQVIDAYLGVGLSPVDLAATMNVTPSRVAQIYGGLVKRLAVHFGHAPQPSPHQRATDRLPGKSEVLDELVAQRQQALKASPEDHAWDERMEAVLMSPAERFGIRIDVPEGTRW